jgi:KUP system potassium uptake protein
MERVLSAELRSANKSARNFIERSRETPKTPLALRRNRATLVIADGILTTAQSVLGAIQGLKVVRPDITSATTVGISCIILVLLFLTQPFDTTRIASSFAPIVIVGLLFNLAFGIYLSVLLPSDV